MGDQFAIVMQALADLKQDVQELLTLVRQTAGPRGADGLTDPERVNITNIAQGGRKALRAHNRIQKRLLGAGR